jgi:hypothetical protein
MEYFQSLLLRRCYCRHQNRRYHQLCFQQDLLLRLRRHQQK